MGQNPTVSNAGLTFSFRSAKSVQSCTPKLKESQRFWLARPFAFDPGMGSSCIATAGEFQSPTLALSLFYKSTDQLPCIRVTQ